MRVLLHPSEQMVKQFSNEHLLFISLHVSEVRVVVQCECSVAREATESNITLGLVVLSQAESTMRADLAIALDSHDSVEKAILLNEATEDEILFRVLGRGVFKLITLLLALCWALQLDVMSPLVMQRMLGHIDWLNLLCIRCI